MYPKCICYHVQINHVIVIVIVVNYFPSFAAVKRVLSILYKDINVESQF